MQHRHHHIAWAALGLALIVNLACGGTKVINQQKTVLHGSDMINVTNVVRTTSRIEGVLPDGETVDLTTIDKQSFAGLLATHGVIGAKSVISFDDQEMIYQARHLEDFSDLKKMRKELESAMKKLQKFMKGNSQQLEL